MAWSLAEEPQQSSIVVQESLALVSELSNHVFD
jgi:hypothetical protein